MDFGSIGTRVLQLFGGSGFRTTFVSSPTADRTLTLPDKNGERATIADIPSAIARDAEIQAAIDAHVAATDPHSQYLLPSEVGSAAFQPSSAFATAAQGLLAGSALQGAAIGQSVQAFSARMAEIVDGFAAAQNGSAPTKQGSAIVYATPVAGTGVPLHPGYVPGRFYAPFNITNLGSQSIAAHYLFVSYFLVGASVNFDRIAVRNTSAATAGGRARLGIYTIGQNGQPTNPIVDAGEIATDTTGDKLSAIDQTLGSGWYGLVSIFNNTCSVLGTNNSGYMGLQAYWGRAGDPNFGLIGRSGVPMSYGVLPATLPGAITTDNNSSPIISLRKS